MPVYFIVVLSQNMGQPINRDAISFEGSHPRGFCYPEDENQRLFIYFFLSSFMNSRSH